MSTRRTLTLAMSIAIVIALAITAACLTACGPDPTATPQPETAATEPPATESPATATTVPTEVQASPTAPAPTVPPTEAATSTEVVAEEPTAAPAEATATLEPTDEPKADRPQSVSGACYHPYFPVRPNATWRYQHTAPGMEPATHLVTFDEVTEDSFIARSEIQWDTPVNSEIKWFCTPEGLVASEYVMLDLPNMPAELKYETLDYAGIGYPPADEWRVGRTWQSSWKVIGEMSIQEVGKVTSEIAVTQEHEIVAEESITVGAGSYPKAMKVDTQATTVVTTKMGTMNTPAMTTSFTMSTWYVEGVGMVKQVSSTPEGETVTELMAIE